MSNENQKPLFVIMNIVTTVLFYSNLHLVELSLNINGAKLFI